MKNTFPFALQDFNEFPDALQECNVAITDGYYSFHFFLGLLVGFTFKNASGPNKDENAFIYTISMYIKGFG